MVLDLLACIRGQGWQMVTDRRKNLKIFEKSVKKADFLVCLKKSHINFSALYFNRHWRENRTKQKPELHGGR